MADLDDASIAALRGALEAALADAEQGLATSTSDAKPVDLGLAIGRVTRMDAIQLQQMAVARRQRVLVRVAQIRSALDRLDRGTYGECVSCGEAVDPARLQAVPEAPFCRGCQGSRG